MRIGATWHVVPLSRGMHLLSSLFNHPVCKPGMSAAVSCVSIAQPSSCCLKLTSSNWSEACRPLRETQSAAPSTEPPVPQNVAVTSPVASWGSHFGCFFLILPKRVTYNGNVRHRRTGTARAEPQIRWIWMMWLQQPPEAVGAHVSPLAEAEQRAEG